MSVASSDVVILGGGIAGCAVADAFARRGRSVIVIDRAPRLAAGASGNPAGLVMPRLTADDSLAAEFHSRAFSMTVERLRVLEAAVPSDRCGVLQLADTAAAEARFVKMAGTTTLPQGEVALVTPVEATKRAGVPIDRSGLWFPAGLWVDPVVLCRRLAAGARTILAAEAIAIVPDGRGWRVDGGAGPLARGDHLILAHAMDVMRIPIAAIAGLRAVRGQVTRIAATGPSRRLRCIVTAGAYVTPAIEGAHVAGATFDRRPDLTGDIPQGRADRDDGCNLAAVRTLLPPLFGGTVPTVTGARASLRATTRDHLPVAGPVPDPDALADPGSPRRPGRPDPLAVPGVPGLWLLSGLGSRGLTTALWTAEQVAAAATGEALRHPAIAAALHPARFVLRDRRSGGAAPLAAAAS